ncbi:MAG: hypothetical protein Kow0062_28430 [Acidobacteriota bacterium]
MALGFYCFREASVDNPRIGRITYQFRFCRVKGITCDSNRDGVIDARAAVWSYYNEPGSSVVVLEGWESVDRDGVFNLHYHYDYEGSERTLVLELDLDKDGEYEERLSGTEAETRLRSLRSASFESALDLGQLQTCATGE